jgi:hypothetical protein
LAEKCYSKPLMALTDRISRMLSGLRKALEKRLQA